jgi:large subunit ribosomal protein L23
MNTSFDVIRSIIHTEKGSFLEPERKYLFEVRRDANKIEIKQAVEQIYNVKVQSVNTTIMSGKRKRVRQELGRTNDWKKAVVTLKDGHKIEVA